MALTNALLKSFGIEQDQRDQIMEAHQAVLDSIKAERDELRDTAAKVPVLEKEIEDLKAAQPTEDWEQKHNDLKAEFDAFKAKVDADKAAEEKAHLYRSMLREAGIDEKRLDSIMKVTDLDSVSVKDGAIVDSDAVKEAITSEWGDFIAHTGTTGAVVDNPPSSNGGKMTMDEILNIKDASERQQAIADNFDLFQ